VVGEDRGAGAGLSFKTNLRKNTKVMSHFLGESVPSRESRDPKRGPSKRKKRPHKLDGQGMGGPAKTKKNKKKLQGTVGRKPTWNKEPEENQKKPPGWQLAQENTG